MCLGTAISHMLIVARYLEPIHPGWEESASLVLHHVVLHNTGHAPVCPVGSLLHIELASCRHQTSTYFLLSDLSLQQPALTNVAPSCRRAAQDVVKRQSQMQPRSSQVSHDCQVRNTFFPATQSSSLANVPAYQGSLPVPVQPWLPAIVCTDVRASANASTSPQPVLAKTHQTLLGSDEHWHLVWHGPFLNDCWHVHSHYKVIWPSC